MQISEALLDLFELTPHTAFQRNSVNIPGKLFVAGEYAVLQAGEPAILFAVDHYLNCTIELSTQFNQGSFTTNLQSLSNVHYERNTPQWKDLATNEWKYVLAAIQVVERLIIEMDRPLQDYHLQLSSDLIAANGQKYGFGSSGAVTVSVIRALLNFYGLAEHSPLVTFKLAAIALTQLHSTGSMADIACNSFGGWIYYESLDKEWLKNELKQSTTLLSLLTKKWASLNIQSLVAPTSLNVLIGWTQSPISTDIMVDMFHQQKQAKTELYQQFIEQSRQCVHQMAQGFLQHNTLMIQEEVANARQLLLSLSQQFNLDIETPALKQLIHIAQSFQFEAKSSGAGGGDCGIAFSSTQPVDALIEEWRHSGIIPISCHIAPSYIDTRKEVPL